MTSSEGVAPTDPHVSLQGFNTIVGRFRDEFNSAAAKELAASLVEVEVALLQRGVHVRKDFGRRWEYCHTLSAARAIMAGIEKVDHSPPRVVDFGGGNGLLSYALAIDGWMVDVLDIDPEVVHAVNDGAQRLGLVPNLRANLLELDGRWPVEEGGADLVIAVSVFEGLFETQRSAFFREARAAMTVGGVALLTFDYGTGARAVGRPVESVPDLVRELIEPSGLSLIGPLPTEPSTGVWAVRLPVSAMNGYDFELAEYTFGSVALWKDPAAVPSWGTSISPTFPTDPLQRIASNARLSRIRTFRVVIQCPRAETLMTIECADGELTLQHGPAAKPSTVDGEQRRARREGTSDRVIESQLTALAIIGESDLAALMRNEVAFWALCYAGRLEVRGDVALLMTLLDFGTMAGPRAIEGYDQGH